MEDSVENEVELSRRKRLIKKRKIEDVESDSEIQLEMQKNQNKLKQKLEN